MIHILLNEEHLAGALGEALASCRHRLFMATANLKNAHIPSSHKGKATPLLDALGELGGRGVEVRVLHSGVPSGPMLESIKAGMPVNVCMRRCIRVHAKAVIVDGRAMYLGSANLTGAGLGAKSARRRNFEAGIWTDQTDLIDPVLDMLEEIWSGLRCDDCGRKDQCPVPLEQPNLVG
jgi:phosphatidylserine/phosphatidylglycerophosphate/cardiolipin synthase-like enzyme